VYVPGKDNHFPDFLSRLPPACMPPAPSMSEVHEIAVAHGPTYDAIRHASSTDTVVSFVRECSMDDWPHSRAACPAFARFLWSVRHDLRIVDGVLVDNHDRVFVPAAARAAVLREVHLGHPGLSTMTKRAKQLFFWPTMHADMTAISSNCETCALHAPQHAREPLLCRPMPTRPGETVAADFFQLGSKFYLALYDVFSQFPLLWPVSHPSTHALLTACRVFFQFSGCPEHWWSDRGGAFDSHEFRQFAASIGMQLHFSSAEYPQSNGAAESAVKILKRLKQVCGNEADLFRATLYLQNTAKRTHTFSPAQVFLGRSVRTPLNPRVSASDASWQTHFHERIADQRAQAQATATPTSRSPPTFIPGDRVLVHNVRGHSLQGVVIHDAHEPRSYVVEFPSGARSVRNRKFLTLLPRSAPPNAGKPCPTTMTPRPPSPSQFPAPMPAPPTPLSPSSTPRTLPPSATVSRASQPLPTPTRSPSLAPRPSSPVLEPLRKYVALPRLQSNGPSGPGPLPRPPPPSSPPPPAPAPVQTRAGRVIRQTWKLRDR
jgi:transposase InsO family protein